MTNNVTLNGLHRDWMFLKKEDISFKNFVDREAEEHNNSKYKNLSLQEYITMKLSGKVPSSDFHNIDGEKVKAIKIMGMTPIQLGLVTIGLIATIIIVKKMIK